jgi:4-amino-4-deoxy-L-arabinose transferase-like glycosyltransferase
MNRRKLLWIFFIILALRALFALSIGFVDDDAYHWTWTQQLDWSYFDHPGMIAWLEKITTSIFGNNQLGIRLPSFLCFSSVVYLTWKLAADLFDDAAATFAAAVILFSPLWGFGGFVSSPEPPFMLFWILAITVFWNGVREDGKRWSLKKTWLWLGVIMGLGFNSKFPTVFLAPGFGLYLLCTPQRRKDLLTPWPWLGALIATLFLAPVLYWNIKYDWPSFKFQFHDRHTGGGFDPKRWLGFLGMQIGLVSPGVFISLWLALIASFQQFREARWRFLFCLSIPSFLIFYPQPLWADFKPHWMGPAYFILVLGVGGLWSQGWKWGTRVLIRPHSRKMLWSIAAFLIPMNFLIYAPAFYPWVPKVARALAPDKKWDLKNDVSNELFGWPEAGLEVLKLQTEVEQKTGQKPFLAGHRYEMTAQTWKATMQRTYMLSRTRSHYTVTTAESEYDSLKGRDAILVGNDKYEVNPQEFAQFDSCEQREFKFYRADELSRIFTLHWCKNFQGIKK